MGRQLNQKNYIAIADWMVADYDLNTRELLTYAIIYGFSQDGESCFSGSLSYLASWLNVSRRDNVLRYLKSLEEKDLISKEKKTNGKNTWCEYRTAQDHGTVKTADHVIILPWMIESGLKDKELVLYALIYGFSRRGSDSYFSGTNEYMAKWIGINKAHINRYLNSLITSGFVERIREQHSTKYKAIMPMFKDGFMKSHQIEYTITTDEEGEFAKLSTPFTNLSTVCTKLSTNTLNKNLSDSDVAVFDNSHSEIDDSTAVAEKHDSSVDDKKTGKGFNTKRIIDSNEIEIARLDEATRNNVLSGKIVDYLSDSCNCFGLDQIDIINRLPDEDFKKLFSITCDIVTEFPDMEKINNPKAFLSSQIKKCIVAYQNTERTN